MFKRFNVDHNYCFHEQKLITSFTAVLTVRDTWESLRSGKEDYHYITITELLPVYSYNSIQLVLLPSDEPSEHMSQRSWWELLELIKDLRWQLGRQ